MHIIFINSNKAGEGKDVTIEDLIIYFMIFGKNSISTM